MKYVVNLRFAILFLLLMISVTSVFCQETVELSENEIMLDFLLPGYARIIHGDPWGYATIAGAGIGLGSQILMFFQQEGFDLTSDFFYFLNMLAVTYGSYSIAYNAYSWNYYNSTSLKHPLSLPEFLLTPFLFSDPEDLLTVSTISLLTLIDYEKEWPKIGAFFQKDTVKLWGMNMHPVLAAGTFFSATVLLNIFVAGSEELLFRDLILGKMIDNGMNSLLAMAISACVFGSMHLFNIFLDLDDAEYRNSVIMQTIGATLGGFILGYLYSADTDPDRAEGLAHAIRYHFFNNLVAMNLNYWYEEGGRAGATSGTAAGDSRSDRISFSIVPGGLVIRIAF